MMQEETIASLTPEAVAEAQRILDQHSKTLLQKMVDHLKQYFGGFVKNKDKLILWINPTYKKWNND